MKKLIVLLLVLAGTAVAQLARFDGVVLPSGTPNGPATVAVCTSGGSGGPPCSPLAVVYSDASGTAQLTNPFPADMNGHYTFFAPAGSYAVQTYGNGYTPILNTVTLGSAGTQTFQQLSPSFQINTTSAGTAFGGQPFSWSYSTGTSNGTTDNELAQGYNMGAQLGRLNTNFPSIGTTDEVDFNDGVHHWLETHLDSVSANNGLRHFIFSRSLDNQALASAVIAIGSDPASIFQINQFSTLLMSLDPTGLMNLNGAITQLATSTTRPMLQLQTIANMTTDYVKVIGSLGGSSPIYAFGGTGGLGEGNFQIIAPSANANGATVTLFSNADVTQHKATWSLDNTGNIVFEMATTGGQMYFDYRTQVNFRNAGSSEALEATLDGNGAFAPKKLNQQATNNFAGTCAMAAGTSCTATLTASFTAPICQVTPQGTSAIAGACSVSGTTVTITAASSNSLTWTYMVVGNPN